MATRKKKSVKKPAKKTSKKPAKKVLDEKLMAATKTLEEKLKTVEGRAEFREQLAEAAASLGERIKVKATPPADKGKEARMKPADAHLNSLRDKLQSTVEPVQEAAKDRMKKFDINALNDFMKNAPAGSFTKELSKEIQDKFDVVWDPPATRFTGVFRRLPILIRKKEAARLDKQLLDAVRGKDNGYQMKMLRSLHLMPSEIAEIERKEKEEKQAKEAEKSPRVSRLEELAHGGIKAESDPDWYEKFNPVKISEEKPQDQMSPAAHLEALEADYAEKTRQFLKAKRELAAAKRALDRGYKEAEEKEEAMQEVVTVTEAKPAEVKPTILDEVEQSAARKVLQVSRIQELIKNGHLKQEEVDGLPSHGVSKEAVALWKKHFAKKEEPGSDDLKVDFDAWFHGKRY